MPSSLVEPLSPVFDVHRTQTNPVLCTGANSKHTTTDPRRLRNASPIKASRPLTPDKQNSSFQSLISEKAIFPKVHERSTFDRDKKTLKATVINGCAVSSLGAAERMPTSFQWRVNRNQEYSKIKQRNKRIAIQVINGKAIITKANETWKTSRKEQKDQTYRSRKLRSYRS